MKICRIILTLKPRLLGSLEVTGTDTDRSATYDFLLVFHSNYGPIIYRFRDKGRAIFANFPTLTPEKGVPLKFCNTLGN